MNKLKSAELMFVRKRFDEIKPHPKNPRVHDDRQIGKLRHSIRTHGFSKGSIVVQKSTGYCLAGHGIIEALKLEGYNGADVVEVDLPDDKALAFLIADNHIADQSTWDDSSLQQLISELSEQNVPSLDFGFDGKDLEDLASRILANSGGYQAEPQDDEIPEVIEPITQTGDLWTVGKHRVLCGDSTVKENVEVLLDGNKVDLIFTDPPYGIEQDKGFSGAGGFDGKGKPIPRRQYKDEWDNARPTKELFDYMISLAKTILIFGGNFFADLLPQGTHWIVWDKLNTMPTFGDCELVWTNIDRKSVKKITCEYNGLIGKEKERFHPTQKPIELLANILNEYSEPDNIILDLFLGSGSTLIACQKLNRVCYGMEIDAHYCDVIVKRYIDFVGDDSSVSCLRDGQVKGYKELTVI